VLDYAEWQRWSCRRGCGRGAWTRHQFDLLGIILRVSSCDRQGRREKKLNETQTCEQRPASALSAAGSIEEVLADFDRHLEGQRGCTEGTRQHYRREARAFLVRAFSDQPINWDNLTAGQIADFVSGRAQQLSLVSRQNPATAIRSLLRFLGGEGLIRTGLDGAVPPSGVLSMPRFRGTSLRNNWRIC
jgi:hypothetical protein